MDIYTVVWNTILGRASISKNFPAAGPASIPIYITENYLEACDTREAVNTDPHYSEYMKSSSTGAESLRFSVTAHKQVIAEKILSLGRTNSDRHPKKGRTLVDGCRNNPEPDDDKLLELDMHNPEHRKIFENLRKDFLDI